ncbi:MAG: GntR family transcriptional regulator [Bacteroidales bacterium]|nr:GntR family transcriptional regulator [Bacteroidales bacterium]
MADIKLNIDESAGQTKLQQLVHSITAAISNGKLKVGEALPSVNQLSSESGFSRDTVFKAYNILKSRNIIESAPQKGYYVASESFRVFMLLDDFSAFKEQLYNAFRQNLPETYSVDLWFHHYNPEVFHQLIQNSLGRYSLYVVMNIDNKGIDPILNKIDANKLLILDMGNPGNNLNFLLQDFNEAVVNCLTQGLKAIQNYNEFILIYSEKKTPHPIETVDAFRRFCKSNQIKHKVSDKFDEPRLKTGQLYMVIKDSELVEIIKAGLKQGFQLGKDFGVISYNDTPMKEIVEGGITVISTDFRNMGEQAAEFVKNKQKLQEMLPTSLILRQSL